MIHRISTRLALAVCAFLFFHSTSLVGQTFRGAINGTVIDPSGAAVPNAQVQVIEIGTSAGRNTVTTADGEFSMQDLPLGTYKIAVTAPGFAVYTEAGIVVEAGSVRSLAIKLSLAQETGSLEVSAAALTVDTTTSTQSDSIPDQAVQNMPLNGRDFTQLIAIAPGYGGYSINGGGTINGARNNGVDWQVDGTDNNDFWYDIPAINQGGVSGIAGVVMPIDAIDEFSTQTEANAENGRDAGGTVNVVLMSGTNQFHGTAYYYNRNEAFAAHSPFFVPSPDFPKAPRLRNENYGFTVGGPIIKNKTFFFFGFETQNYIFGLTGLATEPSSAWIQNAQALLTQYGVPQSTLSSTLYSNLWPTSISNLPANVSNYFASVPATGYSYNGIVKLDHNFNSKHHLSGHVFLGQGDQIQPPGAALVLVEASSNLGYYFEAAPLHVENYSAVLNSQFRPTVSNQLLAGVSYFGQSFHDANNSFNTKSLGLYLSPGALINGQPILGAPNIMISGFDQVGITPPEGRNDITGHLTDTVSYITGKHEIRFGGEFRQGRVDEFYFRRSLGSFTFDGTRGPWAGTCPAANVACADTLALADFLAGDVSASSIAVGDAERHVLVNSFALFGQDSWQVTHRLTLNFGLRYEYSSPLHDGNQDLPVFIPGRGLVIQGAGIASIYPPDRNNFAPRFGFAYQPTKSGNLVVRGGVGVYYEQIPISPFLDNRPPNAAANGLEDNPAGPDAVDNYSRNGYNWQTAQQGGQSIFPGVATCISLNYTTEPGCGVPNPVTGANIYNVFSVGQDFRTPYYFNYDLQVEQALGRVAMLQLGYVGGEGRKLSVTQNINQNGAFNAQYPNVGSINQFNSDVDSNYNALQASFRVRSWRGLNAQFAYTWAHSLDDATEFRGVIPLDSFNLHQEYASSDFDTRNNFTGIATYQIPGSSHGPKILTHGWQVSGLISLHSGQPFNFPGMGASGSQRPGLNVIGNPFAGVSHAFIPGTGEQWVNPAAFCVPSPTCLPDNPNGNLSRNKYYGPNFADVDLSVLKNIPVKERLTIQLRAEMFNVFNRINLATGGGSVGSSGFVTDTIGDFFGGPGIGPGEPFNMQLAAKIIF
ncbi:MAG: TonB-dependent receptor [Candidatus Acidiferrales bacterium]